MNISAAELEPKGERERVDEVVSTDKYLMKNGNHTFPVIVKT